MLNKLKVFQETFSKWASYKNHQALQSLIKMIAQTLSWEYLYKILEFNFFNNKVENSLITRRILSFNPLSANFTKWSNTLKQVVG